MKGIFRLWKWEWKKNRSALFCIIIGVFIVFMCGVFGWFSHRSSTISTMEIDSVFDTFDYQKQLDQAVDRYEEENTYDNYFTVFQMSCWAQLQSIYQEKQENMFSYQRSAFSDYMNFFMELQTEGLQYYQVQGEYPDLASFHAEKRELLEQAITGSFADFLAYEKSVFEEELAFYEESAIAYLDQDTLEEIEQTIFYLEENLLLISSFYNRNDLPTWMMDAITKFLETPFPRKQDVVTKEEFMSDFSLQDRYSTYDDYVKASEDDYQTAVNQRTLLKYQMEHEIEPENDIVTGNLKPTTFFLNLLPFGVGLTFLLFLGFFGSGMIDEHKKGMDRLTLTKPYTKSQIFTSKVLYMLSVFFFLFLLVVLGYLITFILLRGNLSSSLALLYQNQVVEISYLFYIVENMVRFFFLYSGLLFVFFIFALLFSSFLPAILFTIGIGVLLSFVPCSLLEMTYFGAGWFIFLLVLVILLILLFLENQKIYQKKW